jgi:hypothetical protein
VITERLVTMANQIARGVPDRRHVSEQVVTHLRSFWAPSMIDELAAYAPAHEGDLQPEVLTALAVLRPQAVSHG